MNNNNEVSAQASRELRAAVKLSRRDFLQISIFGGCSILASGCVIAPRSNTWVRGEGGWTTVLIPEKISYELAFDDVVNIIMRQFEINMISKDTGYIRTKWKSTIYRNREISRTRITAKISKERKRIDLNVEVHQRDRRGNWIIGYDTQVTNSLKSDIIGVVGM